MSNSPMGANYNPYQNCAIGVISPHSLEHSAYLTERARAMQNVYKNPAQHKLIAAKLLAAEVVARRPEMQVRKLGLQQGGQEKGCQ